MNKMQSSSFQPKNFLTLENNAKILKVSSEKTGCPVTNILSPESKSVWLSEEGLPQEIIIDLSSLTSPPKEINCIGIYCWHAYPTNPKLLEISVSSNARQYNTLGNFDLCLKPGTQLLDIDPLSPEDVKYLRLVIKETFSGKRTYINNIFLYETMPSDEEINNFNSLNDSSFNLYLRESRERSLPRSTKELGEDLLDLKSKEEKFGTINSNNNVISTTENQLLISDSELSEKRFDHYVVPPQIQKVDGGIIEEEEEKEKSSVYNSSKKATNRMQNASIPIEKEIQFVSKELFKPNQNDNPLSNYLNSQNSENEDNINPIVDDKTILTDIRNLEREFHSYQTYQEEKFQHVDAKLTNLETEVSGIKEQIDRIADNIQVLVEVQNGQNQRLYETILDECRRMIDSKFTNYEYNNTSYNSSAHFNKEDEFDKMNSMLDVKLEEKFSDFSSRLGRKIADSLLKPSFAKLENMMKGNLNEVKGALQNVERKAKLNKTNAHNISSNVNSSIHFNK